LAANAGPRVPILGPEIALSSTWRWCALDRLCQIWHICPEIERASQKTDLCRRFSSYSVRVPGTGAAPRRVCDVSGSDWQQAPGCETLERFSWRRSRGCLRSFRRHFPHRLYGQAAESGVCVARFSEEGEAWNRYAEE